MQLYLFEPYKIKTKNKMIDEEQIVMPYYQAADHCRVVDTNNRTTLILKSNIIDYIVVNGYSGERLLTKLAMNHSECHKIEQETAKRLTTLAKEQIKLYQKLQSEICD